MAENERLEAFSDLEKSEFKTLDALRSLDMMEKEKNEVLEELERSKSETREALDKIKELEEKLAVYEPTPQQSASARSLASYFT